MLHHVLRMIRTQGPMKWYSTRAMERRIGSLKKVMHAARYAGENAGNIVEIESVLHFLTVSDYILISVIRLV